MIGYQFLLEIAALNPLTQVPVTLRYSCKPGFTGSGFTWEPRIVDPGLFQVTLFSGGKTTGSSNYSFGTIILDNQPSVPGASGPLDNLKAYDFTGQQISMYMGQAAASFPAGFSLQYTAIIESVNFTWTSIEFTLRGRQSLLDVPINWGTFTGSESVVIGETQLDSLKDKMYPILLGRACNFSPVLVNSATLTYCLAAYPGVSFGELGSDFHVYDNGVELTWSSGDPTPGTYTLLDHNRYLMLGSTPAGQITCSAVTQGYALIANPANLVKLALFQFGDTSPSSWYVAESLAAYTEQDNYECGLYLDSALNVSAVIDAVLAPCGFWFFNHSGKMELGLLVDPNTLTSVYTADSQVNIKSWSRLKAQDTVGGVPASKTTVRYARNYTVQADPAGATLPEHRALIGQEWRQTTVDTADHPTPLSKELVLDTARTGGMPSVVGFYTVLRELVEVEILKTDFLNAVVLLPGRCVTLNLHGRMGYTSRKTLIVGITINYIQESVKLVLWR